MEAHYKIKLAGIPELWRLQREPIPLKSEAPWQLQIVGEGWDVRESEVEASPCVGRCPAPGVTEQRGGSLSGLRGSWLPELYRAAGVRASLPRK